MLNREEAAKLHWVINQVNLCETFNSNSSYPNNDGFTATNIKDLAVTYLLQIVRNIYCSPSVKSAINVRTSNFF
jgi:hypothetical protein